MDLDIRAIRTDEVDRYLHEVETPFSYVPTEEDVRRERLTLEPERALAAFDGDDIVGSAAAYSLDLTIPGEVVPMAGVTLVGVRPTHRRRGILTELMRRQLLDLRDRGDLLAGLWASEGSIYQRFGYGLATLHSRFTIDRGRTAFARDLPQDPGALRMVSRQQALPAMQAVYERARPEVPGMLSRPGPWWESLYADPESHRDGAGPLFFVLHETAGSPDGYVAYRAKPGWVDGSPYGEAMIHELMAIQPATHAALWRFVFGIDLVKAVSAWRRPADEPLLYMLAEPRRLRLELHDALWLRLVDVPAALAARAYGIDGSVVVRVRDDFCPWNDGVLEVGGGPGGGRARPAPGADPDLYVEAADLAAVYLGGTSFDRLVRAGRVTATGEDALQRADAMFATVRAPWCPHLF